MGIGWLEIAVIVLVVLIFFGTKRIPEIASALGKASGEFKKAKEASVQQLNDDKKELKEDQDSKAKKDA